MPFVRWTRLDLPEPVLTIATHEGRVAVGLADGHVLRSDDGGVRWGTVGSGGASRATALLPLAEAVLVGTTAGMARAHGREGWKSGDGVPLTVTVTALAGHGATTIAGMRHAGIYRSVDAGLRWELAGAGLPSGGGRLHIHAAAAGPHGIVVAHALGVSRSQDGGRTWTSADVGLPFRLSRVALALDGPALYVGVGGRLYRAMTPLPDAVLAWVEAYDGPGLGRMVDLLGSADGVVYVAVAESPHLLHSADEGGTWSAVGGGLPAPPTALAVGTSQLLAVLPDGALWHTTRPFLKPSFPLAPLRLDVQGATASDDVDVTFVLDVPTAVALTVCDVLDREVACPLRGEVGVGVHRVRIPARSLAPGLYRCRLRVGTRSAIATLVLS